MRIQSDSIFLWIEFLRFDFHWRLLSLFNVRALEPIPCSLLFFPLSLPFDCLFRPTRAAAATLHRCGWSIYDFDYCPLRTLENCSLRAKEMQKYYDGSHKAHAQQWDEWIKNTRAHQIKLHGIAFSFLPVLTIACRLPELQTPMLYRIKCVTHERARWRSTRCCGEKSENHTAHNNLMTDILSADVILMLHFSNSTKNRKA